jgi:hypothetical protein
MISEKDEYKRIISQRLGENWKSFKILFGLKHYGNCISIMCQELDQIISLLFLLNRNQYEKEHLVRLSINSQKWFFLNGDNKKVYITEKEIINYADSLQGWEKGIYEFGLSFQCLSKNFNYLLRDPMKSMSENERRQISDYIKEYHNTVFNDNFSLDDLIPLLEDIFKTITSNLLIYMDKI